MKKDKIKIIKPTVDDVRNFFEQNKSIHFRYFEKRSYEVISNHVYTSLYLYDNIIFGYGHIDSDLKKWLAIFIKEDFRGRKLSEYIMQDLLKKCDEDIYLTVDLDNISALNLYKKTGFKTVEMNEKYHMMVYKNKN